MRRGTVEWKSGTKIMGLWVPLAPRSRGRVLRSGHKLRRLVLALRAPILYKRGLPKHLRWPCY